MSCIAGIYNLDGAPVERKLLDAMTGVMKSRAPDGSEVWSSGPVGFGHAMLRESPESNSDHLPATLDGRVWITADVRIDGRDDLIRALRSAGREVKHDVQDASLILHAYAVYGERLLNYLIGDFAFVLWDDHSKIMLCARDHFGVRPFYYARTEKVFIFASDIEALLLHPSVSARLDEDAIGDFLLFGFYQDAELTIYSDIRCLPAATQMLVESAGIRARRYWEVPGQESIRYSDESEYVDHFQEVFTSAVSDRLRGDNIALELTGGMDSTSVAAEVTANAKVTGRKLRAYTITSNRLLPNDEEGDHAKIAASHLSIPFDTYAVDGNVLFERLDTPALRMTEPCSNPHMAFFHDIFTHITSDGYHVLLTGQGGDEVFDSTDTIYADLLRKGRIAELFIHIFRYMRHMGSLRGMGLRSVFVRDGSMPPWRPPFPDLINADFAIRTNLKDRWNHSWGSMRDSGGSQHHLSQPWRSQLFGAYEKLPIPLIVRHPFYDIRLVKFLLEVPGFIKSNKKLLRNAMSQQLPESILKRPKTPAAGDLHRAGFEEAARIGLSPSLSLLAAGGSYIDPDRYMQAYKGYLNGEGRESTWATIYIVAPLALDYWLRQHPSI